MDPALQSGAERLGHRLLGGESLGVAGGGVRLGVRAAALGLGEGLVLEALAEPVDRGLDAADVGQVGADADDHARASSISSRIRSMAGARPTKMASPIRKWPMLSSAISGRAAIALTVS